ncbi:MAG: hypothetical protein ABIN89_08205 [Chitinophagaceae bacterium]
MKQVLMLLVWMIMEIPSATAQHNITQNSTTSSDFRGGLLYAGGIGCCGMVLRSIC